MKATTKKLFRNCPKEIEFISEYRENCRNCPKYEECLQRKNRKTVKRQKALKEKKIELILLGAGITLLILSLILVIYFIFSFNNDDIEVVVPTTTNINSEDSEDENSDGADDSKIKSKNNPYMEKRNVFPLVMADAMPEPEEIQKLEETVVIVSPEISAFGPSEDYYYVISYEDKVIMAKVLYVECRGEIFEGKVAVAAVILNRLYSELSEFNTESIYAVVSQGTQFADFSEVTMEDLELVPECMEAVEAACKGWDPTRKMFPEGAKHFYAPKGDIAPYQLAIREGIQELSIGNHNFHNDFNMENVEERVERIIAEQNAR